MHYFYWELPTYIFSSFFQIQIDSVCHLHCAYFSHIIVKICQYENNIFLLLYYVNLSMRYVYKTEFLFDIRNQQFHLLTLMMNICQLLRYIYIFFVLDIIWRLGSSCKGTNHFFCLVDDIELSFVYIFANAKWRGTELRSFQFHSQE